MHHSSRFNVRTGDVNILGPTVEHIFKVAAGKHRRVHIAVTSSVFLGIEVEDPPRLKCLAKQRVRGGSRHTGWHLTGGPRHGEPSVGIEARPRLTTRRRRVDVVVIRRRNPRGGAHMAISMFARIGMIKGESRDAKHKDEIEVLSWSWGVSQSGTPAHGGGGGAGKASFHDLNFTHHLDKASPLLLKACATGEHIKEATITIRKGGKGQQEYLLIKMSEVLVTSVSTSGGAEGDVTMESVALAFAKVDFEYKPQKPDGSLDVGIHFKYDLKANKEG